MKEHLQLLIGLGFAISCTAASSDSVLVDSVRVDSGTLQGAVSGSVVAFKGIPFAAPPVGRNRWRPPQPVSPWNGVRDATRYGADCAQSLLPVDGAALATNPSENCLFVNVWTPAGNSSAKLPVMVWIYGGAFVNGGSSPAAYDGTQFARNGLVFVSFNYRLGRFGFFAHPALTAENPDALLGNYALMDQVAALDWVKRNVGAFGGDAQNVTVFGESAGGTSVLMLLTMPQARGLFQKAIIESGTARSGLQPMPRVYQPNSSVPSGETYGLAFATQAGIMGRGAAALAQLRALPTDQIVSGLNMASRFRQMSFYSGPMIDGKLVVETPEEAFLAGHQARIPLIAGGNSGDFGAGSPMRMRAPGAPIAMDSIMAEPARFIVQQMTAAGQPAFEYRFSYVAASRRSEWKGAPHATEIPYVFDTVRARYGSAVTAADEGTARAANAYWVAFARTGNPSPTGLPKWPKYDPKSDLLLDFTEYGPVEEADPRRMR